MESSEHDFEGILFTSRLTSFSVANKKCSLSSAVHGLSSCGTQLESAISVKLS